MSSARLSIPSVLALFALIAIFGGRPPSFAPGTFNWTEASVEQTAPGDRPPPEILASFDGLGEGFTGPQGTARLRNPSDNSLAVGPDHIVQIVNSRMAVYTKRGSRFSETGRVLYGPVDTNNVFRGFGDAGKINNGDAVVRYDQLADRWLIVMPIFRRVPLPDDPPEIPRSGAPVHVSPPAVRGQPGAAAPLFQPPRPTPEEEEAASRSRAERRARAKTRKPRSEKGVYAMCYAVSTGPDPLGSYYRYQFVRPLFPDYPRPAVWPDGYYVPTSTGDDVIQKHAYVAEREKMLKGESARELGIVIDDVNFLNNADLDGKQLPPTGAPNIMMAAGGTQLKGIIRDDVILAWRYYVDWKDPARTRVEGPDRIPVAPYRYLGGGQLTEAVPQPGTDRRLDAQGDKIMARLVYRRIGDRESIVAVHSVSTSAGGGGVRWYEFRLDENRDIRLFQQGTYAPGGGYRWMASPAIDALGNIGIGYSFGGASRFPGQRFAGRLADDPPGVLSLREAVLVEGEASQTNTMRWEDYTQTAIDPTDDRTIWYVGDYLKKDAENYSTRIGAFHLPGRRPEPEKPEPGDRPGLQANLVFFYYSDLDAAEAFYTGVLGLEKVLDYGFARICRISPTTYIGLVDEARGMHDPDEPKSVTLSFVTDEIDEWYAYLVERKVEMRGPLGDATRHPTRGFVAYDPAGYFLEFERFLDHPQNTRLHAALRGRSGLYPEKGSSAGRPSRLGIRANIIWLYYRDIPRAQAFYENHFDAALLVDQGFAKVYSSSPTGYIGLVDESRGLHRFSGKKAVNVCFLTEGIDAWFDRFREAGIKIRDPLETQLTIPVRTFVGFDPGGYFLEFDRFLDDPRNRRLLDLLRDGR